MSLLDLRLEFYFENYVKFIGVESIWDWEKSIYIYFIDWVNFKLVYVNVIVKDCWVMYFLLNI